MARSPSTVRSVLRKFRSHSEPDIRSSFSSFRDPLLGQHSDEKVPGLSPPTCTTGLAFSPSGSDPVTSSRNGKIRNSSWSKEIPEFKLPEQRWDKSRYARSSFMLHPMLPMSCRGLASGGAKNDTTIDLPPTTPTDDATDVAQSIKYWAESAYNGIVDSAKGVADAVDVATPPIKRFLEAHPIVLEIAIPVSIFTGAWVILPKTLRRIHGYWEQGSGTFLQDQLQAAPDVQPVPYRLSVWGAMEVPARLFATLLTMLQIGVLITSDSGVSQYLSQFWSGGSVVCVVWFLHRWKANTFERLLTGRKFTNEERHRYLQFDKFVSLGLLALGGLGVAEAIGVAPSSLLTVGGIGGIATAFAAREILANLLTGVTLSFSRPFTVGDSIKAGTLEGKVEEVGMFKTRLLNREKNPMSVPNSFFTSQAIINMSQAQWRILSVKIPIHLQDFETVPRVTMEIREMLYRNANVYLEEDKPTCHIAQFSPTALEIAIACNIKPMSKSEYLLVEQEILVEAARIITTSGATLGGS